MKVRGTAGLRNAIALWALLASVGCGGQSISPEASHARNDGLGGDTGSGGMQGASASGGTGAEPNVGGMGGTGGTGAEPNGGLGGSGAVSGIGGGAATAGAQTGTTDPPETQPLLELYALARGASGDVAVGRRWSSDFATSRGVIYQSSDGTAWSLVASDLPSALGDVEYGNGRFVALGAEEGTLGLYGSNDGVEWTAQNPPGLSLAPGFAFGNGVFVTQGNNAVFTSEDGATWESTGLPRLSGNVEFAAGEFVIADVNGSWLGSGKSWEPLTVTDAAVNYLSVRGFGDHFRGAASNVCCFGEDPASNQYYRLRSTDGASWTTEQTSAAVSLPLLDDGSLCIDTSYGHLMTGPDCEHLHQTQAIPGYARAALQDHGVYLVAGDGGIFTSTDGASWTRVLNDP